MTGRTIKANGPLIKQLRLKKGWTQEDLAEASKLSVPCISNLERSKNVVLNTLRKLSKALDNIDLHFLFAEDAIPLPPISGDVYILKVRLSKPPSQEFDEADDMTKIINELSSLSGDNRMEVIDIRKGSVLIDIEMPLETMEKLIDLFKQGKLKDLGVEEMTPPQFRVSTGNELPPDVIALKKILSGDRTTDKPPELSIIPIVEKKPDRKPSES